MDKLHSVETISVSFDEIPVVDIGPLLDDSDPQSVADQLADICQNIGFLYIKNHGISAELISSVYAQAEAFFGRPLEEKKKVGIEHSGKTLRGYIAAYGENVDPRYTRDTKECFDYGADGPEVSPFFGPNPLPAEIPDFKEVTEAYHHAMLGLARKLVGGIALSLGLPRDFFESRQQHPITIQRLTHYPPQSGKVCVEEMGIGAHTDYGFLTILHQDDNGGLQVQNRVGDWVSAPPIPGTFVVNIGDLVETLTNGRYRSTVHRVINTSGNERYSIPFFIDMDFDAYVEPVPTCTEPFRGQAYPPFICGQHKFKRFLDSYAHLAQ